MKIKFETIGEPIPGLPDDFRYPCGYFEHPDRVIDPAVLEKFDYWLRPYIIHGPDGKPKEDRKSFHFNRGPMLKLCKNLQSALHYVQFGGSPDESMELTIECEEKARHAIMLTEAGYHGDAIRLFRSLPMPFQKEEESAWALAQSLFALGHYDEAFQMYDVLIPSEGQAPDHLAELAMIAQADIFLAKGQLKEARYLLNINRNHLERHYQYYGSQAALAFLSGDESTVQKMIARATRADTYHHYKIMWHPCLKPLRAYMRRVLLTENGTPRAFHENSHQNFLAHKLITAFVAQDTRLAEQCLRRIDLSKVRDRDCGDHVVLALFVSGNKGLFNESLRSVRLSNGVVDLMSRVTEIISGSDCPSVSPEEISEITEAFGREDDTVADVFTMAEIFRGRLTQRDLPDLPIAIIHERWTDRGLRPTWFCVQNGDGQLRLIEMMESNSCPLRFRRVDDPRKILATLSEKNMTREELKQWFEERLRENKLVSTNSDMLKNYPYEFLFNGMAILDVFGSESLLDFPELSEVWSRAKRDCLWYYSPNTHKYYGFYPSFPKIVCHLLMLMNRRNFNPMIEKPTE